MAVWLIRGVDGAREDIFIKSNSIGISFGVGGDARRPDDVLKQEIRVSYLWWAQEKARTMKPSALNRVVTRYAKQVKLFRDGPVKGDTVIMPRKGTSGHQVRRGIIESGYEFWEGADWPHRRKVRWESGDVPRETIPYSWYPSNQQTGQSRLNDRLGKGRIW